MAAQRKTIRNKILSTSAITLSLALASTAALADVGALETPTGETVAAGSATFDRPEEGLLNINQATDRVVIDWDSFNIGENATTEFFQPGSGSLAVNRVNARGSDPTQILGTLKANGNVMILDRNGVITGRNSKINVGGIVMSTGNIDNAAAMRGDSVLELTDLEGNGNAGIELNGEISIAGAGLAAFVAPTVKNGGIIEAKLGRIDLSASRSAATVDLYGDGLVELAVSGSLGQVLAANSGTINGKTVKMSAEAAKEVVDTVINMNGVINASSVSEQGGKIILSGGQGGVVKVTGKLDASGEKGGVIKVTGHNVWVDKLANLFADGGQNGDGGEIRVIGENAAIIEGKLNARGGAVSGNGGFVEVSGLNYLDFTMGNVDTTATNGLLGSLLIDPLDITIRGGNGDGHDNGGAAGAGTSGGWQNLGTGNSGSIPFAEAGAPFDIYKSEIEAQSATTNIIIQAQRNITTVAGGDNLVTLANNSNLTIETQNNVGNNGSIDLTNLGFQVQGTGSMNITAATGTVGTGDVRVGKLLAQNGNIHVATDNGQVYLEKGAINVSGTGSVAFNASDRIFLDNDITTNGGSVTMEANRFTIDDSDASASPENLDQIKTNGGFIRITANEVTLGEAGGSPAAGEVLIDAGNGAISFERKTAGTFGLGGSIYGDTQIDDAELASLRARELFVGSPVEANSKTTAVYIQSVDTTANITGEVSLSAMLNQDTGVVAALNMFGAPSIDNNNVFFVGGNSAFNGLSINANDHILLTNGITVSTTNKPMYLDADANHGGIGALVLGAGSALNSAGGNVTFNGHEVLIGAGATINAAGGNITLNNDDVFYSVGADSLVTAGNGTITLNQWDKSFVDNGGSGFSAIGSINNAVQALNNTGNGLNTVHVGAGTYDENVIVNQKNILIRSMDGRDTTIVNGSGAFAGQGTFEIAGGINNTQIGETGHGFTINGFDGPTPGIERAAVYYTGVHTTSKIQGNKIVANGDEAIATEYNKANNGITIDNNIITGNTFTGADGAWGTGGDQFVTPNTPRQLVALNLGNSNVTFSNNMVTGNAGDRQLVAIESAGANVFGNNFDGLSTAAALRVRGSDVNVYNNDIDGNGRGVGILAEKVKNLRIGGPLVGDGNDVDFTGGDAIAVIDGNLNLGTTNITNNRIGQLGGANSIGSGAGGGDGIFVKNTDNAVIKKNTIKNAHINAGLRKGSGILVVQSDGALIGDVGEGNIIDNSGSDGIVLRTDGGSNDGNKIVGNTITGALDSRTGIYTELATNTTIDQNTVSGSGRYAAIYGYGGSDFKITKNILKNNDEMGILVQSAGGTNLIDGNKIDNTGEDVKTSDGTNSGDAIHVTNTSGLTISNNEIGKNGGNIQGDGVYVSGSNGVVIKTNKINDTRFKTADANGANGSGIQVVETTGVTIGGAAGDRNTITNAEWDGIRLQNDTTVSVLNNSIDNVGRVGIWGGNINTATINDNIVKNDHLAGYGSIHADGGTNWTVAHNDVDFGDYGIFLNGVGGTANVIGGTTSGLGNTVDNVTADGVRIVNTVGLTVANNKIGVTGPVGGNGIWSLNNNDANIYSNTITGAGMDGILVQGGTDVNIGGNGANTVKKSGDDGIDVEDTLGTVVVKNNVIDETGLDAAPNQYQSGIEVSGTTGAIIEGNKIRRAAWDGINVQQSAGTSIKSNIIYDTLDDAGIAVHNGVSNITIDDNVITKSVSYGVWANDVTGALTVTNNDISDIKFVDGIRVTNSTGTIKLNNNDIYNVGNDGIAGYGDIDEVSGNRILKTGANGIVVTKSDYVDIKSNKVGETIGTNTATRIRTTSNGTSTTTTNTSAAAVANNIGNLIASSDGIYVENSAHADIIGNSVSNTANDGIFIDPSDYSVIAGNTVTTTGGDGIESANNSYITIGGATTADGNTISGAGAHGINVHGGVEALIQNNTVKGGNAQIVYVNFFGALIPTGLADGADGAQLDGIHVVNNDGVNILNNTITAGQGVNATIVGIPLNAQGGNGANQNGIFVSNSDNAVIDTNMVLPDQLGSGIGALVDGIHVENSDNLLVGGLTPLANGNKILSTGRDGIYINGSTGAFVLNNIISGASVTIPVLGTIGGEIGDDGIDMQNTIGTLVAGNIITDTKGDGIEFSEGALSAIGLNFITNAGDDGIKISNSALLAVGLNQIDGTVNNGISLTNTALALVGWNNINNAKADGINVLLGASLWITNNDIKNSGDDGIDATLALGVAIDNNTIEGAGDNGIEANLLALAEINDNKVGLAGGNIGGNGIDLRNSAFVNVNGNDIGAKVKGNGIFVDPSFDITIDDNDINGVGHDGIHAIDTFGLSISNNRINTAGNDGIHLGGFLGVHDVELLKNVVTGSAARGLHVSGRNNGTVVLKGNKFTDNPIGAEFQSGTIDLTAVGADRNIFTGGDVALRFDPKSSNPVQQQKLKLVDNDGVGGFGGTIGETEFVGQSQYYVELRNGAFFLPGSPTVLNGYNATYDGFRPDTVPYLTLAQYNAIENKIQHYVDDTTLGLFFFGNVPDLSDKDLYKDIALFGGPASRFRVTILGLPKVSAGSRGSFAGGGNIANLLAGLAPAAGGNDNKKGKTVAVTPEDLAKLEPAAGGANDNGDNTQTANTADSACWSQAVATASSGAAADYSFGGTMEEAISQTAACGSGAQF